jgi:hypothetical protein
MESKVIGRLVVSPLNRLLLGEFAYALAVFDGSHQAGARIDRDGERNQLFRQLVL